MRSDSRIVLGARVPAVVGVPAAATSTAQIVDVRTEPPVIAREAGGRVLLGASAAGPLGGDHLGLELVVEASAAADVGTVGATMLLPGRTPAPSSAATLVDVGAGASIVWRPEPTISVVGSVHDASMVVQLAPDATCRIVDELSLGRSGERSGVVTSSIRVERAGRPLVHHAERYGPDLPGAGSSAASPQSGHVVTSIVVGPGALGSVAVDVGEHHWAGRMPLAPDAHLAVAIATDRPEALLLLAQLEGSIMV